MSGLFWDSDYTGGPGNIDMGRDERSYNECERQGVRSRLHTRPAVCAGRGKASEPGAQAEGEAAARGEGGPQGMGGGGIISQEGAVTLGKVAPEIGRDATVVGPT